MIEVEVRKLNMNFYFIINFSDILKYFVIKD